MQSKKNSWIARLGALLTGEPKDAEELMDVLRHAEDRHVLNPEALSMIERIMQVSEMQAREIMVPRAQMVCVYKDETIETLLPTVKESGHSRFPVMERASKDKDVVGILLAKDLLTVYMQTDSQKFAIENLIRPAFFTPQSKRLDVLLREFRINRNHIAIVLDEYGHVAGLVTIEDVLEQIVGDIEDEYDIDESVGHIKKLDDGTYIVQAQTPIAEFNSYFSTDFSDDTFDTIGGIVSKQFGHLPKRGENIKIKKFNFKVLHSDHRRIYLIEVRVIKKSAR
jgi:magnesium and cobalt transporter